MKTTRNNKEQTENFTLHVPFDLANGEISDIKPFKIGEYDAEIESLTRYPSYILKIGLFKTEEEAQDFFNRLNSFFVLACLRFKNGFYFPKSITPITMSDEPRTFFTTDDGKDIVAEGIYDGKDVVIRPKGKKILRLGFGEVTVSGGIGSDILIRVLKESLEISTSEVVIDEKLQLAIDLYSSSFLESSDKARFITYVTVLEALTTGSEISNISKTVLKSLKAEVIKNRDEYRNGTDEWKDLDLLHNRVSNLKQQAIGTSIRNYINQKISKHDDLGDPDEIKRQITDIYKHRSLLLHGGTVEENRIREGHNFLFEFIPKLLEKLYIDTLIGD